MPRLRRTISLFVATVFAGSCPLRAHGDLHERIEAITSQIERIPGNAQLYLDRAELRRLHEDWDGAEADYARVMELAPEIDFVHLGLGLLHLARNRLEEAGAELDRYVQRHPEHVEALAARARTRTRQKKFLEAAEDYTRAISASLQPRPEHYIDRARALAAANPDHVVEALAGLDEGMSRLGPIVTLGLCAVDLELARNGYDAALKRIDALSAGAPRKETWLERRGDILKAAGRADAAIAAYRAALGALDLLPPHVRQKKGVLDLHKRLQQKLEPAD